MKEIQSVSNSKNMTEKGIGIYCAEPNLSIFLFLALVATTNLLN